MAAAPALVFRFGHVAFGLLLLLSSAESSQPLCRNREGSFIGLAIDEDAWESIPGEVGTPLAPRFGTAAPDAPTEPTAQSWTLTEEESNFGGTQKGPKNSYAGKFLQVLPDGGRTYPELGKHIKLVDELVGVSPSLVFRLRVTKEGAGLHTLFVRWTGGDNIGGGDSFFVTMYRTKGKGDKGFVSGEQTIRPVVVPINDGVGIYAGCCYDHVTHACPCIKEIPAGGNSSTVCPEGEHSFVTSDRAESFGVQCALGQGDMEIVHGPKWYLFAGQEAGDVMDFDSEPWDTTCEAEGSNTRDSGHDFPMWNLDKGEYELRIYAREDGTALDGIYVVGPDGEAPGIEHRYTKGDSTLCEKSSFGAAKTAGFSVFVLVAVGGLVAFVLYTEQGRSVKHVVEMRLQSILQGRPSALQMDQARVSIAQYEPFSTEG